MMAPDFPRLNARSRRFSLGIPNRVRVSPDGTKALFLRSDSAVDSVQNLYLADLATGHESCLLMGRHLPASGRALSPVERGRRERARIESEGIVEFGCDAAMKVAVVASHSTLLVVDVASGAVSMHEAPGAIIDPRPSPDGSQVAYVHAGDLRVFTRTTGVDVVLAAHEEGRERDVTWGMAEYVAAEEMGRSRGYWWSPEGDCILAARVDTAAQARWYLTDTARPADHPLAVRYPVAGGPLASVRLFLLGIGQAAIEVEWSHVDFPYLASVHWSAAGPPLLAVQSRDQRRLVLMAADRTTGHCRTLRRIEERCWVPLFEGVPAWSADGALVTVEIVDDAHRLVVDGVPVSDPELQVRSVSIGGDIAFTASGKDPTEIRAFVAGRHDVRAIGPEGGVQTGTRTGDTTVLTCWDMERANPRVVVRRGEGPVIELPSHDLDSGVRPKPIFFTAGEHEFRCALLLPELHEPSPPLPVLLDAYGGPASQRVLKRLDRYLTPQWFANHGFAVLLGDGFGTPGRGPAWERLAFRDFADSGVAGQVETLGAAAQRFPDLLDLSRVAIRGWSHGGYLAALSVLRRPDLFHAAVVGGAVSDWRLYDSHFTERYLGSPDENDDVYERNSLLQSASKLTRPMLVLHGLLDDNVFPVHASRLSAALNHSGHPHELLLVPGVTHLPPTDERVAEWLMHYEVNWLLRAFDSAQRPKECE